MAWLSILRLALRFASWMADIVRTRQVMEAGEAKAMARTLRKQHARVDKALAARRRVRADPGADDPDIDDGFRRD